MFDNPPVLDVDIPLEPPGINQTYKITCVSGKARMYKSKKAKTWATDAALIIGSGGRDFTFNIKSDYLVKIDFAAKGYDVDAPVKLILDTLCQKLGFNDKYIDELHIKKNNSIAIGIRVRLYEQTRS